MDWWAIARANQLNYHPNFDDVAQTFVKSQPSDRVSCAGPGKPLRASQQQENRILQAIAERGYKPRCLPQTVRAEIRACLLVGCLTSNAFGKARGQLRDGKQIAYEIDEPPK